LLTDAKARPGQIPTGVSMGATSHLLWILLGSKTGTNYKYVPFQGGTAGRITGLLNGTIDLGGINMAAARSQLQAMATGAKLIVPSHEVCEHAARQFEQNINLSIRDWPGHLRRLDALDPGFRQ